MCVGGVGRDGVRWCAAAFLAMCHARNTTSASSNHTFLRAESDARRRRVRVTLRAERLRTSRSSSRHVRPSSTTTPTLNNSLSYIPTDYTTYTYTYTIYATKYFAPHLQIAPRVRSEAWYWQVCSTSLDTSYPKVLINQLLDTGAHQLR